METKNQDQGLLGISFRTVIRLADLAFHLIRPHQVSSTATFSAPLDNKTSLRSPVKFYLEKGEYSNLFEQLTSLFSQKFSFTIKQAQREETEASLFMFLFMSVIFEFHDLTVRHYIYIRCKQFFLSILYQFGNTYIHVHVNFILMYLQMPTYNKQN